MNFEKKNITFNNAVELSKSLKSSNKSVGLCHGCFDLMHIGHVRHFVSASKNCDFLFVSVTPNEFVNKGPDRPVIDEIDRALMISTLNFVDFTFINKYDSGIKLIQDLKPTYYFKGVEYKKNPDLINPNFLKELEILKQNKGEMIFTSDEIRSSTKIINKIKK